MSDSGQSKPAGPDLSAGVPASAVAEGSITLGHVADEPVIVVRSNGKLRAIGATCTHYGGPLADGIVVGDTVRCPWHHACFSLRTGEALQAPALDPVACFRVEERDGKVFVRERVTPPSEFARDIGDAPSDIPSKVVIVGAGAAGVAAAEMLRRCGYKGSLTLIDQRDTAPVDRPNLSKDYLAGTAQEEWVSLRPQEFFTDNNIDLVRARVTAVDPGSRTVKIEKTQGSGDAGSGNVSFDRLLIATGATPNQLEVPGADLPTVHYLRTLADSKAIIAAATTGKNAVIIGSSFIGLEVAASLRARNVGVHVVAPESVPLARVLGAEMGNMVQKLHEQKGVVFHLGTEATEIRTGSVSVKDGSTLPADFVVVGVGVHPDVELAKSAGLTVENGVIVNAQLETSAAGIYAAGDIASWPDPRAGRIRVEHWVVAERQGQTAARNMLGAGEAFTLAPFFWSHHYDMRINYVGHAQRDDGHTVSGDPMAHDCTVVFSDSSGKVHAEADVGRDKASLRAQVRMDE
ncbi:MAG: FAD-dependent oxidoreductase [Gemmatimonadaceae bacterium]